MALIFLTLLISLVHVHESPVRIEGPTGLSFLANDDVSMVSSKRRKNSVGFFKTVPNFVYLFGRLLHSRHQFSRTKIFTQNMMHTF